MQKNIFKSLGIFAVALFVMSMAGAASAFSLHGHSNVHGYNNIHGHNNMHGHNHNWNGFNYSNGQSCNDGSCNCCNDGSCNCCNDGSCNCCNDGSCNSGISGNNGSGNSVNDGSGNSGNRGNDGSGNSVNDGSGNSGNSGNDGSGNSGNDGSTDSTPSAGFVTVHPHEGNTYWVGEDGHMISLINNNSAVNPTYSQLLAFIEEDKTDEQRYIPGKYTCGDFAETVHNNAEKAGYKAGWVTIEGIDHCCNAFQTSDEGMIYIDCTGSPNGGGSWDSSVKLANGVEYQRIPLSGENFYFDSMGIVSSYKVYW